MVGNGKVALGSKGSAMRRKAFTLIELLVVIAIIILLVAIIVPSFATGIAMARSSTCQNHLNKLGQAFSLSIAARTTKDPGQVIGGNVRDMFPPPLLWPGIPMDASPGPEIYQCPEEEQVIETTAQALARLEYQSQGGSFSLDGPGTYQTMFKKRRGTCPQGAYTEYLFQDDFSNQYNQMDFNGWVDTDGGCRVYDSGVVHVWLNIELESEGSVPDWSGAYGGYPTGINTCGNMNNLLWVGVGAFNGDPKLQNHKGEDWPLPEWGGGSNYGISSLAYKHSYGSTVIVLADYLEAIVNLDTPLDSQNLLLDAARHLGKVNYLKADGSVETAAPLDISPVLQPKKWSR